MLTVNRQKRYRYDRRRPRWRGWYVFVAIALFAFGVSYFTGRESGSVGIPNLPGVPQSTPETELGRILKVESVQTYPAAAAEAIARENYAAATLPATANVTKVVFRYRSQDLNGTPIAIYGRAYIPDNPGLRPIWGYAPGTTGLDDRCAGSLEQPKVANWANYDSHMMMYATQGYASVITDYDGMRDPARLHHYMVGALEGRAVLDSIRALKNLPQASGRLDTEAVFVGGYSQGGHAAYWADKIQRDYAPDISLKGVVGYGPVMSVKDTLADVAHGANINWFGPYVLASYSDYYQANYGLTQIFLPARAEKLAADVKANCVDTVIGHWGRTPSGVYTPEFIGAMLSESWVGPYAALGRALDRNLVGDQTTASAKRINQGQYDNVVLPKQQERILPKMCRSSRGPVELKVYPGATHYNTMVVSLVDTLEWMRALHEGRPVSSSCPS